MSGALGASGINKVVSMISGGLLGAAGSIGGDLISSKGDWSKVNIAKAAFMGVLGVALGAWTGAGSQNAKQLTKDINSGVTWGSKAFLNAVEAFSKQQTNRTMQQIMYMKLNSAIILHAFEAIAKVVSSISFSTLIGGLICFL